MMDPAEAVLIALIIVGLPMLMLGSIAIRFFRLREKLEVEALREKPRAVEKNAQRG